jgi:hypothetical protein
MKTSQSLVFRPLAAELPDATLEATPITCAIIDIRDFGLGVKQSRRVL